MTTIPKKWVPSDRLTDVWAAPADPTLEKDLEALGGELTEPWTSQ